jgi:hypothetical protein
LSEVFSTAETDGSADSMAEAIAGYGGDAMSDNDATSTAAGSATGTATSGVGGGGGAGAGYGGTSGDASGMATLGDTNGANVDGGDASGAYSGAGGAGGNAGSWGSGNGGDGIVNGESYASAAAVVDTSAFNQSIVMGANVLGNSVDTTMVGGSMTATHNSDDTDV